MRSFSAFLCAVSLLWIGACVNVDKPTAVVLCEGSDDGCKNPAIDASAGSEVQPVQDGEIDSDLSPDGHGGSVPGAEVGGSPDRAPDRVQDAAQGTSPDAAQDVAQYSAPDVATDLPSGPCWGAVGPLASGLVCRKAVGSCDVDEVCDGVSAACPPDQYAPTTVVCRPAAGLCDIAESCTGSSPDCPVDAVLTKGTLCRPAAGPCDVAESCSGSGPDCPDDLVAPAATICRASTDANHCDPAETCTGSSISCPANVIYALPVAPANVGAVAGTQQATISWDLVSGATGYNVKRSPTSGSGYTTQGAPPTTTAPPYVSTGLTGGTKYYYVVSSVNTISTCESANSLETSVTPTGACVPPAAPTLTAQASNGQVLLTWTASAGAASYTVTRSTTTGTGYLFQATVTTGTSYTDINVSNGTNYFYVVTASNGTCSSVYSNEAPASPTCTPPPAPTNLVATPNNGTVALTWTASAGAVSYRVLRSTTSGSGYGLVGTSATASYTDSTVVNGTTYYYVVTASNGTCNSATSAEKSATPACTPPSVPTGLVATPGDGQIVLAWTPSTGGAISYLVQRSRTPGGPYTDSSATVTSTGFTDVNLTDGTTYYYVVTANGSCPSAASAEVSAKPLCTPPAAPTGLLATPGDDQVTLSWTAPTTGTVVSYTVTRTTAGADSHTDIPGQTATTYLDSPLVNGTTYSYVVSASNGTCLSAPSTPVSATPVKACSLTAPTGVTAVAGNQQVTITWSVSDAGSLSYAVKRGAATGGPYNTVVPSPNPAGTVDTAVTNGTTYYYVVTSSNGACTSPISSEASAKPVCTPPAVPTGVTATPDNGNGNITVGWNTVDGATGYTVSRGTSASGPFTAVSTNKTAANFTDPGTGLTAGTSYYYVVSSCNASGTCVSANSTPAVSAVSCSSPGVPSGVNATAGIGRVTVSWTASTGSPTSYTVSRRTGTTGSFTVIKTGATGTSYVDSNVTNGTTYYYEVAAQNGGGACSSASSGASSAATPRNCTVLFGNASNDHTGSFTAATCFVTCDPIGGWVCSNSDGRQIKINSNIESCSAMPLPAPKTAPYTVIDVAAGTNTSFALNWWSTTTWATSCTIPAAGLDF